MSVYSTCNYCSHKAEYYCKACKSKLCRDHVSIYTTVYHCDACGIDCFEPKCPQCGRDLLPSRHEEVIKCGLCNSTEVVDAISYYRQLPHLILASYEKFERELSEIWFLNQRYIETVKTLFDMRSSKIMLFSSIEDKLSLLKNTINTFIDQLSKFENDTFSTLETKLQQIMYLRVVNFNYISEAEEILRMLDDTYNMLKRTIETKTEAIEKDIESLEKQMSYLKFQYAHLEKLFSFIPEKEEELISILPRIIIRKNHGLPKKYILVLTNKNIYFIREKGLINVKVSPTNAVPLSFIISFKYKFSSFFGANIILKTSLETYQIFARTEIIEQFSHYFELANNYYEYSTDTVELIKELAYDSITMKDLAFNVKIHFKLLNARLMNQKDVLRDINYRQMLEVKQQKLIDKLLAVSRKIDEYLYNSSSRYPSNQGRAGILNELRRKQYELTQQLEKLRKETRKFDQLFGLDYGNPNTLIY